MARALRERRALFAVAASLLAATVFLAVPASKAAPESTGDLKVGAEETVLRLHDLPPGYRTRTVPFCVDWTPSPNASADQRRAVAKYRPASCLFDYMRLYRVPGFRLAPPTVVSESINTRSEEASDAIFKLFVRDHISYPDDDHREVISLLPDGPTAHLARFESFLVGGKPPRPAVLILWRYKHLLARVTVAGMKPQDNRKAAIRFAQIQQGHLEAPTPYTEAEKDEAEVPLDDPRLKVPVYWVGNPFEPGGGLPPSKLESSLSITGAGEGAPGQKSDLNYDGFRVSTWTARGWKRFQSDDLGKLNLRTPCTRKTEVDLEEGKAVIYTGYGRKRLPTCPDRPPDRHWAVARIGRLVIGVNLADCSICVEPGSGPYNSVRGIKAILGGLEVRPKPVY